MHWEDTVVVEDWGGGVLSVTEFLFLDSVLQSHPISFFSRSYPLHLQGNRLPYPWQQATSQSSVGRWGAMSSWQCGHPWEGWHWRGADVRERTKGHSTDSKSPPNEEFIINYYAITNTTGFCIPCEKPCYKMLAHLLNIEPSWCHYIAYLCMRYLWF